MSLILNKKNIPYFVIAGLIIYILMIGKKETVTVEIPKKTGSVEINDPKPEKEVDTVYVDSTDYSKGFRVVEVENPVNEELLQKYNEAIKVNDSLKQLSLYKEAIKERNYTEKLEDSIQVITVKSEVVGTLRKQVISYETKPQTITFKTNRAKPVVYIGGFTNLPTIKDATPSFGLQIQIANKKRVLTGGIDNKKEIHIGYAIKLF